MANIELALSLNKPKGMQTKTEDKVVVAAVVVASSRYLLLDIWLFEMSMLTSFVMFYAILCYCFCVLVNV